MMGMLVKWFIRGGDPERPEVREKYGALAGALGIALNALLFLAKYAAGVLTGSIAVSADAFNNLSDALSSVVTLFGFKLAAKRPHSDHPFGHGRIEYVAGLIVSLIIILMGFDLGKRSLARIAHPGAVAFSPLSLVILALSILVKLYMAQYNRRIARVISSVAMRATATDALMDAFATSAVLISMLASRYAGLAIDGWAGALVAVMILWAGVSAARETISPLLGSAPDPELVGRICAIVRSYELVTGMHDLMVHDYGAGRRMVSLHAEVPVDGDLLTTHDTIDLIERRIARELNCHAVIHMDPIATDEPLVNAAREAVLDALRAELGDVTIHDFRMVAGPTHTNVIFDAVPPTDSKARPEEFKARIERIVSALPGNYNAVVTVDEAYVR